MLIRCLCLFILFILSGPRASALDIHIIPLGTVPTPILTAFENAAAQWERYIKDPITVTIQVQVDETTGGTLGFASPYTRFFPYESIRGYLIADALKHDPEDMPTLTLPEILPIITPATNPFSGFVGITKANWKAIGMPSLEHLYGPTDGFITLSSQLVGGGAEPVALHEIGHILGFMSGIDAVEFYRAGGYSTPVSPYTMDLFRFREQENPSSAEDFTTMPRILDTEGLQYIDDGINRSLVSTGWQFGSGFQASHWHHGPSTGIMEPIIWRWDSLSPTDVGMLDVTGWDVYRTSQPSASEPTSLMFSVLGILFLYSRFNKGKDC